MLLSPGAENPYHKCLNKGGPFPIPSTYFVIFAFSDGYCKTDNKQKINKNKTGHKPQNISEAIVSGFYSLASQR